MTNEINSTGIPFLKIAVPTDSPVAQGMSGVEKGQNLPVGGKSLPQEADTPSREHLTSAVDNLNKYVRAIRRELQFSIDENSGRTVIKVLDAETKEIIRQIPPEEVVLLSKNLGKRESVIFSKET
ncbi:flagellar protein FlaG [Thiolapillus brandeum]|uniref:Flagellar protein FlaG n=1 Tax=Thiolapillus brandeum TaxID=1076588 RepID=A0A7U6GIJ1_9GAMM|nr:flagellar protein FlaG [Thiolapillus brandeum]BAO44298.1 flagellar protein FlaG [Thiolapillus brandeum]